MLYLLDTNTVSDLMRGDTVTMDRAELVRQTGRVLTCSIVRGEVLFGIERMPDDRRRRQLLAKAEDIFSGLPCEPITATIADTYAHLKTGQERQGLILYENDLWIAATALILDATLVSRDTDFSRISNLRVGNWSLPA